jgi:putative flippase GtrA
MTATRPGPPRGRSLPSRAAWWQLTRFAVVGASGYAVNLAVFALAFSVAGLDHRIAATAAFLVAVTNNFTWNRIWTFRRPDGRISRQAARFLTVSLAGFALNLVLLEVLIAADVPELAAQATAVALVMPFNFLLNRRWTFGLAP